MHNSYNKLQHKIIIHIWTYYPDESQGSIISCGAGAWGGWSSLALERPFDVEDDEWLTEKDSLASSRFGLVWSLIHSAIGQSLFPKRAICSSIVHDQNTAMWNKGIVEGKMPLLANSLICPWWSQLDSLPEQLQRLQVQAYLLGFFVLPKRSHPCLENSDYLSSTCCVDLMLAMILIHRLFKN